LRWQNGENFFRLRKTTRRALDGDQGLNTGAWELISTPFLSDAELKKIGDAILNPWLRGCAEKKKFLWILYPGIISQKNGARVWNSTRASAIPNAGLPDGLENDSGRTARRERERHAGQNRIEMETGGERVRVMATAGYPGNYEKGKPIRAWIMRRMPDVKVFTPARRAMEMKSSRTRACSRRDGFGQGLKTHNPPLMPRAKNSISTVRSFAATLGQSILTQSRSLERHRKLPATQWLVLNRKRF